MVKFAKNGGKKKKLSHQTFPTSVCLMSYFQPLTIVCIQHIYIQSIHTYIIYSNSIYVVAKYDICEKVDFFSLSFFLAIRCVSHLSCLLHRPPSFANVPLCYHHCVLFSAFVCKIFNGSSRIRVLKSHYINFCYTLNALYLYERLYSSIFLLFLMLNFLFFAYDQKHLLFV